MTVGAPKVHVDLLARADGADAVAPVGQVAAIPAVVRDVQHGFVVEVVDEMDGVLSGHDGLHSIG